jgi:hypothetical protein
MVQLAIATGYANSGKGFFVSVAGVCAGVSVCFSSWPLQETRNTKDVIAKILFIINGID